MNVKKQITLDRSSTTWIIPHEYGETKIILNKIAITRIFPEEYDEHGSS